MFSFYADTDWFIVCYLWIGGDGGRCQVSDMKNLVRQAEADLERAAESPELANLRAELARTRRENQALRSTNAALEDAQVCLWR